MGDFVVLVVTYEAGQDDRCVGPIVQEIYNNLDSAHRHVARHYDGVKRFDGHLGKLCGYVGWDIIHRPVLERFWDGEDVKDA